MLVFTKLLVQPRNRVAHAVAKVDASITESNTSKRGGQKHLSTGFKVGFVLRNAREVLDGLLKRPERKDVRDGVTTLVSGTLERVGRARHAFVVWDGGVRFECVE